MDVKIERLINIVISKIRFNVNKFGIHTVIVLNWFSLDKAVYVNLITTHRFQGVKMRV